MHDGKKNARRLPVVLTALVAVWITMGWLELPEATEAGFDTDGNHSVIRVSPGSPAETAGLQAGDVVVRIGRFPVEDAASIARLPRPAVGESRVFTIRRDGEEQRLAIRFEPLTARALSLRRVSAIIGLCFALFPLLAFYRRPCNATRVLLVMGVGLSLGFGAGPYIAESGIRALTVAVTTLFMLVGTAAMDQFLLVFPHRRPWLARRTGKILLYAPALLLWVLLAWRMLFTPAATTALNTVTNLLAGIVVAGYLLAALFLVLRNYSRTDRAERRRLALNGMLWGTVIGVLPAAIAQLVDVFSPQARLPGQDYYFISLVLIPLTWSRSASREN